MVKVNHYVYMLRCGDGTLYTGYTTDVNRRLHQHERGQGAKYTKGRLPLTVVYTEIFSSKSDALKAEYVIKQLSKGQKEQLIIEGGGIDVATK